MSRGQEVTVKVGDIRIGLGEILREKYRDCVQAIIIPDGRNKEEQDQIFDMIFEALGENEEVYFDVTHGFRTIPMLAITVLNYAKVLKNIEVKGIYYGAFEGGYDKDGIRYAPILEYSIYMDILDWSAAANSFIRHGNSGQIDEIYKKLKREENRQNKERSLAVLSDAVQGIGFLTHNIETCKGRFVEEGSEKKNAQYSIRGAYQFFKTSISKITENQRKVIKPFEQLLLKIEESIDEVFSKQKTDDEFGIATIEWCIKNNLIQQGFTALEESLVTYTCDKYGVNYNKKKEREAFDREVINAVAYILKKGAKEEEVVLLLKDTIKDSEYLQMAQKLPIEIAKLANKIGGIRNNINHFGYNEDKFTFKNLNKNLKDYYNEFRAIKEKYKDTNFNA